MNWTVFQWHSLKTKITFATLGIFLAGIWSLSFYTSRMLREDMERLLGEQQFSTVSMVAAQLNRELESRLKALEMAASMSAKAMRGEPAAMQTFIEQRLELHALFNLGAFVTRTDGTAIADFPLHADRTGVNYLDRDYIAAPLKEGKATIGRPVIGKKAQAPIVGMAAPIRDAQGRVIGSLAGVTSLGFANFMDEILNNRYGRTGGFLLVMPQQRLIVTATEKSRIMEVLPAPGIIPLIDRFILGYEGSGVAVNPHGVEMLVSAKGIPAAGWYVTGLLPTAEAFAPIRDMQQRMLLATLLLTLLAGVLTWWILRHQLAPLLVAAQALDSLPETNQNPQPLPITRHDEIGQLIGGFNRLLETLGKREATLRESEEYFRLLFENGGDAILFAWPDGRIESANPAACRLFGYSEDEFRSLGHSGIMDSTDPRLPAALELRTRTGRFYGELRCIHHDGRIFDVDINSTFFSVSNGESRTINQFRDITERKRTEETLRQRESYQKALLDNFPFLVWLKDKNGRFLAVNQPFADACGLPSANMVVGKSVFEIWPKELAAHYRADDLSLLDASSPINVEEIIEIGGKQVWFETYKSPVIENGQVVGTVGFSRDINDRRRMEGALRASEARYRAIFQTNLDFISIARLSDGMYVDVNQAYLDTVGYAYAEIIGHTSLELNLWANPPDRQFFADVLQRKSRILNYEARLRKKDGELIWGLMSATVLELDGVPCTLTVIRDITERKQAEGKLQLAASVFSHAREGILITNPDGTIIDVNDSFTRITGYSRDEALGCNPRLIKSDHHEPAFYAAMWRDLIEKGYWFGEIWNRRKNGELYAEMKTISAVRDEQGATRQYVALFSDITALKEHEKQLEHMAHYDVLTTLPNRVLLADRLHQAMAQAGRRGQLLAVAYLDLDGFKAINDTHGHETGDQLLIALATRMKQTLREGDTLARLGGDEFVAVLFDLADVAACVPMLDRLLAAAAQPVQVGDLVLQVSASLGVTFYPQAEEADADQLLRQADQAMYQAKLSGKNRYHLFDTEQNRSVRGHHESLEHIRRALTAREFVLHYQPKVNMRTGKIIGAEALIRWQHPDRGLLPPAMFLPVIEDHSLAVEIGEWVIDTALTQIELWHAAGLDIPVSVNVGARQLLQSDFVERLREIMAAHPAILPDDLEIEVLETSALEDLARVSQIIEDCRGLGVNFSLDDFGTGYSSLTYLKCLSVNQLKIDQSFVRDMLVDPDDLSILGGVLSLATAFRRQVIAEGVETVEHGTLLLQLGCELAQGYGIARPMPAADFPAWAMAWRPDSAWSNLPAVNHDDLPLLFASVEHRAWIAAVEDFLGGKRETLPLVHHQCRFDSWLEAEGQALHDGQTAFLAIEPLHRQTHALATELCELQARGQNPEALARLGELHGLRDALLVQLQVLVQENRQQA